MNNIDSAKDELLREAANAGNQVCKILNGAEPFVKARRGYSYPDELRSLVLRAFEELLSEGKLRAIVRNKDLELYELVCETSRVNCKEHARKILIAQAEREGEVYKIHSPDGEFVQVGPHAFYEQEEERILFLEVLGELTHKGKFRLVSDSKELGRYEIAHPYGNDAFVASNAFVTHSACEGSVYLS